MTSQSRNQTGARKQNNSKRRTQAERTEASDNAMYKAAVKLIARKGPQSMTLLNVGKEAGFSGGLVSYRFGTKINLLKAVSERILFLWNSRALSALSEENDACLDVLDRLTDIYLDAVNAKSDLFLALFRMMNVSYSSFPDLAPYFQDFDRVVRQRTADVISRGKESGEIRSQVDARAFAQTYIAMLRGTAMQYFMDSETVDLKAARKMISHLCHSELKRETS